MERPVLVTGATGFIGRHLVAALRRQGRPVRVLVRRADDAAPFVALGATAFVGDLLDRSTAHRAVPGIGAVFHLAGKLFTAGSKAEEYSKLHIDATVQLFEAALVEQIESFVLCSTTGVHGPTGAKPAREDDHGVPDTVYEKTKALAERAVITIAARTNAPLVIARPGLVYGPGDLHLLGWFRSIRSGYYRVVGRGENHLHPIYIDDLVHALQLCASRASAEGRAYHLVGTEAVTMRALSDAIGTAVGRDVPKMHLPVRVALAAGAAMEALPVPRRSLPLTRSRVKFLTQNRAYDGTRAREELGFIPAVALAEGLSKTVAWYRESGLL